MGGAWFFISLPASAIRILKCAIGKLIQQGRYTQQAKF
jgi:hypothetical protein